MPPTRHGGHSRRDHGGANSTPSSSSRAPPPAARGERPQTPEYQPLSTPVNAAGQRALSNLLQSTAIRHLKTHLQQVTEKLSETASEANERAASARIRHDKAKTRKNASARQQRKTARQRGTDADGDEMVMNDEEDEEEEEEEEDKDDAADEDGEEEDNNDEETRKLERLEAKVKTVTDQMEEKIRAMIDADIKLEWTADVVQDIGKEIEASAAASQAARRRGALRGGNRRRRELDDDEDEDMVDADADEDEDDDAAESDDAAPPSQPPSQILQEKLAQSEAEWQTLSPTQKYSTNNTYIGFYRIVHEARHPGDDIPPVPHPSTWFTHLENGGGGGGGSTSPTRSPSATATVDDDIAIERERISLKCPLTLVMFTDPVSSTKCVHSFERQAIEDMINQSSVTVHQGGERGARAQRVRVIDCPVCSVQLTLNDLKRDPVIMTRVRRARAAEQREAEEADFERVDGRRRHRKGGRRSGFTVASDDDEEEEEVEEEEEEDADGVDVNAERMIRIKRERSRLSSRATMETIEDD